MTTAPLPKPNRRPAKQSIIDPMDAIDAIVHYRNLAIVLGAKPTDMLDDYDRQLCEKGIDPNADMGGLGPNMNEIRQETKDLWERADTAAAGTKNVVLGDLVIYGPLKMCTPCLNHAIDVVKKVKP